jgi:hypothetical protein
VAAILIGSLTVIAFDHRLERGLALPGRSTVRGCRPCWIVPGTLALDDACGTRGFSLSIGARVVLSVGPFIRAPMDT